MEKVIDVIIPIYKPNKDFVDVIKIIDHWTGKLFWSIQVVLIPSHEHLKTFFCLESRDATEVVRDSLA